MLPQPPPNAAPPPAGAVARRSRRTLLGIVVLGIASILLLLVGTRVGMAHKQKITALTQASGNARSLAWALSNFDADYGAFPDNSTIIPLKEKTATDWEFGNATSNELLKQLIAAHIVSSEEVFYVKQSGTRKPDNLTSSEAEALKKGECGFAYIPGATSTSDPARPLMVAPLIPGTFTFDPEPFGGKALVLQVDNSVIRLPIESDGRVLGGGGLDLFDPKQPYWDGKTPDVKWPDLLPSPPPLPWYRKHILAVGASLGTVLLIAAALVLRKRKKENP
jgi:hypothetical protein